MSRVLWHAGRADVDRPTIAGRTAGEHHGNSGLGLFCATLPRDYIRGFGEHLYALTVAEGARVLHWSIHDLRQASDALDSRGAFEGEGRRLAQDFDLIEIEEIDGTVEQVIVLNDAAIVSVDRIPLEYFKRLAANLGETPKGRKPNF